MCSLSNGEVDPDLPPVDLHTCAFLLSYSRILVVLKIYKTESPRMPCLGIDYNLYTFNRTIFAENMMDLLLRCVNTQPKHSKASIWLRIVPAPIVPAPIGHGTAGMSPPAPAIMLGRVASTP